MSGAKFEHFLTDREVAELLKVSEMPIKQHMKKLYWNLKRRRNFSKRCI